MNTIIEQFQKKKDLWQQWNAIAHSDWYQDVIATAKAELFGRVANTDGIKGALLFEEILSEMANAPEESFPFPKAGITHALDKPKPTLATFKTEKK